MLGSKWTFYPKVNDGSKSLTWAKLWSGSDHKSQPLWSSQVLFGAHIAEKVNAGSDRKVLDNTVPHSLMHMG